MGAAIELTTEAERDPDEKALLSTPTLFSPLTRSPTLTPAISLLPIGHVMPLWYSHMAVVATTAGLTNMMGGNGGGSCGVGIPPAISGVEGGLAVRGLTGPWRGDTA